MKTIITGVFAALAGLSSAQAQDSQLAAPNPVIDSVSATQMMAFLADVQFDTRLDQDSGAEKVIVATKDGMTFFVALRQCQAAGADARCSLFQPFGYFPGDGVTYDVVNSFHLTKSNTSTVALLNDNTGVIVSKVYLQQGVTVGNLGFNFGVFLLDVSKLFEALSPGAMKQVAFTPGAASVANEGLGAPLKRPAGHALNPVGPEAGAALKAAAEALLNPASKIETR